MSLPWFKFYATDFLTDPKIIFLSPVDKYLFIILLCLATTADDEGFIPNMTEEALLRIAHTQSGEASKNVLTVLQNCKLVTLRDGGILINNFQARQEKSMTDAERAKKYRDKQKIVRELEKNVTECDTPVTDRHPLEEIRQDKTRKEKNIKKEILKNTPEKRTPLSEMRLYEIAGEKNIKFSDVKEIHKNILEDISGPNKYKVKSVSMTLFNWIKIQLAKGYIHQMGELERMDWEISNPEVVAKDRENTRILLERGLI